MKTVIASHLSGGVAILKKRFLATLGMGINIGKVLLDER